MSPARSSRRPRGGSDGRAIVEALDAGEARRLLASLLDAHPELHAEATTLADAELGAVTVEGVAEDVAFALGELRVEDVWDRSGAQSDGSYVEPSEAAWAVVQEAVSPFLEDLGRRIELGREEEAIAICQGALLGLYRVSEESRSSEEGFLGGYGSDLLGDAACFVVETWKKGGGRARPRGARRARHWAAMRGFASKALPEWRSFLTRVLGRAPARRERG